MKKNVIYQKFLELPGHPLYPYPPLVIEPDTDYICFSTIPLVTSSYWKIIEVKSYSEEKIKSILAEYKQKYEVYCSQIIVGYLFQKKRNEWEPVVTIPEIYALPKLSFNLSHFTPTKDQNGKYFYKRNPVYSDGIYNGRRILLTIGVPVSNQIDTIDRCLSHIKPLLEQVNSELVVVNTGSTDGTLEICKAYGARIIDFPWCDNMSAARNTGIYHAMGEWYMSVDDDEWFEDISEIIKFFKEGLYKNYDGAYYIQRNYKTLEGKEYTDAKALRLARIKPETHFEGRIHDALIFKESEKFYLIKAYAYHYGFARGDKEKSEKKYRRNGELLLYDIYEYPDHLRYNYQMAKQLGQIPGKKEAYAYYLRGISIGQELGCLGQHMRNYAIRLISTLYYMKNNWIFYITRSLEKKYDFTEVERAYINFLQSELKLQQNAAPQQVLTYYQMYEYFRKEYERSSKEKVDLSDLNIEEYCTDKKRILDGKIIALCAYCQLNNKGKVLELLQQIEIAQVGNTKNYFCRYFLSATQEIYSMIWERFINEISDEWMEAMLVGALWIMVKIKEVENPQKRISELLKQMPLSALEGKIESAWNQVVEYLGEEPLGVTFTLNSEEVTIQEAFFYRYLIKKRLDKIEIGKERRVIFRVYIQLGFLIVTSYYSYHLLQEESHVISADLLAAYQIGLAWDGLEDRRKAFIHLRKAEEIYPSYTDDIEDFIKENHLQQTSQEKEFQILAENLKQQIRKLITLNKQKEAERILEELTIYIPEDKEIEELWKMIKS